MTKVIVETTGNFMLLDRISGEKIPHDQPSEPIPLTTFITERADLGQLRILKTEGDEPAPLTAKEKRAAAAAKEAAEAEAAAAAAEAEAKAAEEAAVKE